MTQATSNAATVVNVLATGSVSAAKFTTIQLAKMDADLLTLGNAAFNHDKSTGSIWRTWVLACERNGIVIKELQKELAKRTATQYVSAWCAGLKKKELSAAEDKRARANASNSVSQAFRLYRTTPAVKAASSATSEASNTSNGGTKDDGLSVGNSIKGILEVQALIANALKVQTAARERLVTFQTELAGLKLDATVMESIGTIALDVGSVQDDLAKLDKMLTA